MPDVVSAPQDTVVTHGHKRLDGIVLENEAVLADALRHPDRGPRTEVSSHPVALMLHHLEFLAADCIAS